MMADENFPLLIDVLDKIGPPSPSSGGTDTLFKYLLSVLNGVSDLQNSRVGSSESVASPSGSANAKLAYIISTLDIISVASDNVRLSADPEILVVTSSSVTAREFLVTKPGVIRVKVDAYRNNQVSTSLHLEVNGSIVTPIISVDNYLSYDTTYTWDILVLGNSKVSIVVSCPTPSTQLYIKNCRVCCDLINSIYGL